MGMTYKRGTVWWVKYYRNGRPFRESSQSRKESDAINLLKLREGDIAHGLPVNPKAESDSVRRSGARPQDRVRRQRAPIGRRARAADSAASASLLRWSTPLSD
jgi:hypothetical protein